METFKTAVVVVLLLAVLAGVYLVLNKPPETAFYDPDQQGWLQTSDMQLHIPGEANPSGLAAPGAAAGLPGPSGSLPTSLAAAGTAAASPTQALGGFPPATTPPATTSPSNYELPSGAASNAIPPSAAEAAALLSRFSPAGAPAAEAAPAAAAPAEAANPAKPGPDFAANVAARVQENPFLRRETADAAAAPADVAALAAASPSAPAEEKTPAAEAEATSSSPPPVPFEQVWKEAQASLERQELALALVKFSKLYRRADLNPQQYERLVRMLDALAGTVIYSREHWLEPAYVAQKGETLTSIAKKHQAPWRLLQNINGVRDPEALVGGTQLKVLRGPFRCEIDLSDGELTLFLGEMYAGRFAVQIGGDPRPKRGAYLVLDMQEGKTYIPANGSAIPAMHPDNPYGQHWISLGGDVCIHGASATPRDVPAGCVGLRPIDAADVYGILSLGSEVLIQE